MKSTRLIAPVMVAVCLLVAALAWSQGGNPPASTKESGATSGHGMTAVEQTGRGSEGGNAKQELKTLSNQAVQASLKGDSGFVEQYYADDAMVIHSDGKLLTKAQEIESIKSGNLKYESIDVRESNTLLYGNVAVVEAMSSVKGTLGGKPIGGDFRSTRTWVRRNGNWKCVAYQATRVPTSQ